MPAAADFERERLEIDAILTSGILSRAPNLAHLLSYICAKYFDGEAEQIKEYSIAVEALGRSPEFDQKKDSIVRVEAHRLRKRLREYYEGQGAGHAIQVVIPPGQYAPKFIARQTLERASEPAAAQQVLPVASPPPALEFQMVRRWRTRLPWKILTAGLLVLAVSAVLMWSAGQRRIAAAPTPELPVTAAAPSGEIRILAGLESGNYMDGFGRLWQSDRYFNGGAVFHTNGHAISGARDPRLYQNRREGAFTYDIPLKPGVYELRLHFAETLYGEANIAGGGEGSRLFDVLVNGKPVLREFDVIGEGGPSAADIKVFKDISPASDGMLHLAFDPRNNSPFLNAIEIAPGIPGRMRPLRITARDRGFADKDGNYWEPDRYVKGGQLVLRADPVSGARDPDLYRGERFGNLVYTIPVASGTYSLTMHFAETWFGPGKPGGGGAGSRLFDILCNGVALLKNVDIYAEAGGSDRALTRIFHHLEPNPQGKLVISLLPIRNYACINALEIEDESK